jgi:hypothetical protein
LVKGTGVVEFTETSKATASIVPSSEEAHLPEPPHDAATDRIALARIIVVRVHIMAALLNGWTNLNLLLAN